MSTSAIRRGLSLALATAFLASDSVLLNAGGILTDGRYEDDFQGGALLTGWQSPIGSQAPENGASIDGYDLLRSPFLPESINPTSNLNVHVEFDYIPGFTCCGIEPEIPETLPVLFAAHVHSQGYDFFPTEVAAYRVLESNSVRFAANIPFASLAKLNGSDGPIPHGLVVQVNDAPNESSSFGIDNFVLDWSPRIDGPDNTVAWGFHEFDLPPGWSTSGSAGSWVKYLQLGTPPHQTYKYFDGIAAVHDGSPPHIEGETPELRIRTWSPPFRFVDLARAVFSIDLTAVAHDPLNDRVEIDLYRVSSPELPSDADPSITNLYTLKLVDLLQIADNTLNGKLRLNVLHDTLEDTYPAGHEDNKSIYRIRTRVFDNDVNLNSFDYVEIDDITMTNAVLHTWGDFTLDDVVDGADFLQWQRNLGSGSDTVDLLWWKTNFNAATVSELADTTAPIANRFVPEAQTSMLAMFTVACGRAIFRIGRRSERAAYRSLRA